MSYRTSSLPRGTANLYADLSDDNLTDVFRCSELRSPSLIAAGLGGVETMLYASRCLTSARGYHQPRTTDCTRRLLYYERARSLALSARFRITRAVLARADLRNDSCERSRFTWKSDLNFIGFKTSFRFCMERIRARRSYNLLVIYTQTALH